MAQTSIFKILYIADYTQAASAIGMMQARIQKQEAMIRKLGGATGTVTKQTGKMGGAMTKAGHAIHNVSKKTGGAVTHFNRAEASMGKMIISAIKWAAVFTVVYTAIRGMVSVVQELIRTVLELEQAMADIASVTDLTGKELEKALSIFKKAIISYAADSREAIKDMTRSVYLLETAGLDVQTALKGFPHVMNLVTATMGRTEETTKIMAGLYNTLAANIEGVTSAEEKFKKMSDVLAYTIAREQVLIGELQQGMQYIAPEAVTVTDSFTDLVTTIGFLNTKMLKGSKAGRLQARMMMQIIKNADKLKDILGITFDPQKPINVLNTIRKINDAMGYQTKLTFEQRDILREIFAMRGGRPAQIQIAFFEELEEAIRKANTESEGFAKNMKEVREITVGAEAKKSVNIFKGMAVILDDITDTSKKVGTNWRNINVFLRNSLLSLVGLSDNLEKTKSPAQAVGKALVEFLKNSGASVEIIEDMNMRLEEQNEILKYQSKLAEDRWTFENKIVSKVLEYELSLRRKIGEEEEDIARARIKALEVMDLPLAEKILGVTDARFKLESAILNKILEQRDAVSGNIDVLEKLFKAREDMGIYERRIGGGRVIKELMEYAVGRKEYKNLTKKAKEEYPIYFPERARERGISERLEREGIIPTAPRRPTAGRIPAVTRAEVIAREIANIVVNQDIKNRINIGGVSIEVQPGMTAEQIGDMAKEAIEEAYRDAKSKVKELSDRSISDYE